MAGTVTPDRVMAEIERVMSRPFAWGPCDCCSAACGVFHALWGIDPMASVEDYQGPLQAARLMRRYGGLENLSDILTSAAGLQSGHAIGGLAITPATSRHRAILICIQPGLWAGKSKSGFAIVHAAEKGWHA